MEGAPFGTFSGNSGYLFGENLVEDQLIELMS